MNEISRGILKELHKLVMKKYAAMKKINFFLCNEIIIIFDQ